ncbi:MAG: glycosyltransferase, partial [Candidatus Omnitrophica bacterium]|nr:glycosyltransferase [Candidatus Omnitrophota bacterium]
IGDGPIRDALLQTIEESGLNDTVKLLGAQPRDKIIEFLGKTDVFLLPSKNEAFSVALLEAQAMEVPVVACNVGGISSAMNDQQTGFLVPLNDVEYTVKTIMKLFDNETLRSSLGKAGRKFVENHGNIKNINHQLEEIYFGNIRSRNRHAVLLSV